RARGAARTAATKCGVLDQLRRNLAPAGGLRSRGRRAVARRRAEAGFAPSPLQSWPGAEAAGRARALTAGFRARGGVEAGQPAAAAGPARRARAEDGARPARAELGVGRTRSLRRSHSMLTAGARA